MRISRRRILIAEDSLVTAKLMLNLLRKLGYEVVHVENGQQVLDLYDDASFDTAQSPAFDLILMDGTMPVLSGFEATRQLRLRGVQVPVVAVTGNAMAEDMKCFREAGADIVLTKPVTKAALERSLSTLLK